MKDVSAKNSEGEFLVAGEDARLDGIRYWVALIKNNKVQWDKGFETQYDQIMEWVKWASNFQGNKS